MLDDLLKQLQRMPKEITAVMMNIRPGDETQVRQQVKEMRVLLKHINNSLEQVDYRLDASPDVVASALAAAQQAYQNALITAQQKKANEIKRQQDNNDHELIKEKEYDRDQCNEQLSQRLHHAVSELDDEIKL